MDRRHVIIKVHSGVFMLISSQSLQRQCLYFSYVCVFPWMNQMFDSFILFFPRNFLFDCGRGVNFILLQPFFGVLPTAIVFLYDPLSAEIQFTGKCPDVALKDLLL